jgi:predicted DNA-binding transcriptional regulator AlpA
MTRPSKLCTTKELRSVYGIMYCRQHLWRLEKLGKFPNRVQVGLRRIGVLYIEIEAWLQSKLNRTQSRASSRSDRRPGDTTVGSRPCCGNRGPSSNGTENQHKRLTL